MLQPGDIINGKYQVQDLIGRGGMSVVYKATNVLDGTSLAIKDVDRSKEKDNSVFEERLTEEGQMLKMLSNPHLPRIYDIIENPDSFMLVMDFVEGESLDKVIAKNGAQSEADVIDWGIQICDVFSYLHSQNPPIIYRDMKPANVILQPGGKIMMIDFGTARTQKIGQDLSSDTICIGTEGFAAPEQYGGMGESDARTDIFCLGGTLYNLVTGHSPFDFPKGIHPLGRWNPDLEGSPLDDIIAKCTQRSPFDRYQTAEELKQDLLVARSSRRVKRERKKNGTNEGFQKQSLKTSGALSGLSGLLQRGAKAEKKTGILAETKTFEPQEKQNNWQAVDFSEPQVTAVMPNQPPVPPPEENEPVDPVYPEEVQGADPWYKLLLGSVIAAAALLILSVVFLLNGSSTPGFILLIFGVAAAALAVAGLIKVLRSRNELDDAGQY